MGACTGAHATKSTLALSVALAFSALAGCSSPDRGSTSPTGGNSGVGGTSPSSSSSGGSGGAGSGGAPSSGGATGQGGSGGSSSGGAGGSGQGGSGGSTATASGGTTATTTASGGTTAKGGSGGAGGSGGSQVGGPDGSITTATGGTTAKGSGGSPGSGGTTTAGGNSGSGGATSTGGTTTTTTGPQGPCDIYQAANTPCGAAHSTVRALYASYSGPLYQVQRASDKTTKDIVVGPGGFAQSSDQDSFCSGTTCTIPIIYDQSPNGNHLRVTWFAYWLQSGGNPATANAAKISVGGHTVYGIKSGTNVAYHSGAQLSGTASITNGSKTVTFSSPQTLPANTALLFVASTKDCPANSWSADLANCKYRTYYTAADISAATTATLTASYIGTTSSSSAVWNESTKGVATGDEAEAEYSVFDAKTYGQWCCFDYGNAEIDGIDEGNATMEAISWAADTQFGQSGGGSGPWIGADLENGMFEGYENGSAKVASNTSVTGMSYVTAMLKGLSAKDCPTGLTSSGCFALKGGNSQSGKLEWKFSASTSNYGARPPGYSPQKKQGAIILGTGGDGSNTGTGIWFEGAMTKGAPPDATDDAVQANIVAAGYGK